MRRIPLCETPLVDTDDNPVVMPDGSPAKLGTLDFIASRLADQAFASSMDRVMLAVDIKLALAAAREKKLDALLLDDASYEVLVIATKTPGTPYNPAIAMCLMPHMKAITEAPKYDGTAAEPAPVSP